MPQLKNGRFEDQHTEWRKIFFFLVLFLVQYITPLVIMGCGIYKCVHPVFGISQLATSQTNFYEANMWVKLLSELLTHRKLL